MKNNKWLLLIVAFLFSSIFTYGQEELDTLDHELIKAKVLNEAYSYIDTCVGPNVSAVNVVLFDSYANAFFDFSSLAGEFTDFTLESKSKNYKQTVSKNSSFYLMNLPLNQEFELISKNKCDEDVVVANFDSKINNNGDGGEIKVSPNLFRKTSEYFASETTDREIYETLVQDKTLTYYEKLEFIQKFYLDGNPFSVADDYLDRQNPEIYLNTLSYYLNYFVLPFPSLDQCVCKLTVTNGVAKEKDGYKSGNGNMSPHYETIHQSQSSYYHEWKAYSRIGAARYEQAWQSGSFRGDPYSYEAWGLDNLFLDGLEIDVHNIQDVLPHYWNLEYNLLCHKGTGGSQINDCNCEKEVVVYYDYSSMLDTDLQFPSNLGTAFYKKGSAQVEDYAIMAVKDHNDSISIIKAKGAGLSQDYKKRFNADLYLKEALNIASRFLISLSKDETDSVNVTPADIGELLADLNNLIEIKPYEIKGTLGSKNHYGPTMHGHVNATIEQNKPKRFVLYSAGAIKLQGTWYWHSNAKVTGSGYLAGYAYCGAGPSFESYCDIIPGNATWISGTVLGNQSLNGIKSNIDNFYTLYGWNAYPNTAEGNLNIYCNFGFVPEYSSNNNLNDSYYYEVYSIDGRLVKTGYSKDKNFERINLEMNTISGIYIIRLIDDNNQIVSKKIMNVRMNT